MIEVDETARLMLQGLREGVGVDRYLDDIWHRRDIKQGVTEPNRKMWPFVNGKEPEARVNVAQLPASMRRKV